MAKLTKKMQKTSAQIDSNKQYSIEEAMKLVKAVAVSKFDETIDIALNLNLDPRKAEQNLRGVVQMPAGLGKNIRVVVFAKGDKAEQAKQAGADFVGSEDLMEKILGGWIEFDCCIATPDMMGLVGKCAKALGPHGLMPNPKLGTVTMDVGQAVEKAKSGQVEYRCEKAGIVHAGIGKASFSEQDLLTNAKALIGTIVKARPAGVKGTYVQNITLSSTMSPGIKLELSQIYSF